MRQRVIGLLGVVAALVIALLVSATPASASRMIGSSTRLCLATTSAYQPVRTIVDALAGDTAANTGLAGDGSVAPDPTLCSSAGYSVSVLRSQVDRLELDYVGPGRHTTYVAVGPVGEGKTLAHARTADQANIRCSRLLAVRIYVSVRYSDGSLARFGVSGPTFHRC